VEFSSLFGHPHILWESLLGYNICRDIFSLVRYAPILQESLPFCWPSFCFRVKFSIHLDTPLVCREVFLFSWLYSSFVAEQFNSVIDALIVQANSAIHF
jgi:hypothetical protein